MLLDQVPQPVQLFLPERLEARVGGRGEPPPRGPRDLAQERPPEGVALQRPVPVRPPDRAHPAPVQERLAAAHLGDPVMDLVSLHRLPERRPHGPAQNLLPAETHPHRQESEPLDQPGPRLHLVLDGLTEHLEPAADAQYRASLGSPTQQRAGQTPLAQPGQGLHGAPRPRHDHEVRVGELLRPVHEPHHHTRLGRQRVHIGEVRHERHRAHRDPQDVLPVRRRDDRLPDGPAHRHPQPVLLVDAQTVGERQHPVRPPPGELVQHVQAGLQQRHVTPELVHEVPRDQRLVLGAQQRRRAEERGEHAAPVDVPDDQHGEARGPRDTHVHDVRAPQIDLGRTARPFADHGVIRAPELLQAVHDRPEQRLLPPPVVAARTHLADRLPHQDHLTGTVAPGLEQHRVHQRRRLHPGGLCLHRLGPADLRPLPGDERVQRHVLRLERRDLPPRRTSHRQIPAVTTLFPASEVVPATSSPPLIRLSVPWPSAPPHTRRGPAHSPGATAAPRVRCPRPPRPGRPRR